jgi:predicted transglutaminase-like cysteine proteinase
MKKELIALVGLSLGLLAPASVHADPISQVPTQDRLSPFMRVYGPTYPPFGFVKFCERDTRECRQGPLEESRLQSTGQRLTELKEINLHVNRLIEPATDLEVYGQNEYWTIPTTKGDCEDYALLKRHLLMARGWPASALLMTVVRDEKGEGHAVLTARTAQGDLILDNKTDEIRFWNKTPYGFVMRQSYIDPKVWVSLDARDAQTPALLSGVRNGR